MAIVKEISILAERLSEKKQMAVLEFLRAMVEDDFISEEEWQDVRQSREELANGDFVRFENIKW